MDPAWVYGNSECVKRQDCTLGKIPLAWLDCIREKFPLRFNVCRSLPGFVVSVVSKYVFMAMPSVDLPLCGLWVEFPLTYLWEGLRG